MRSFFELAALHALPHLARFEPRVLCGLLHSFAGAGIRHDALRVRIEKLLLPQVALFNNVDLYFLLAALVRSEPYSPLLTAVAEHAAERLNSFDSLTLSKLLAAVHATTVPLVAIRQPALDAALRRLDAFSLEDLRRLLTVLVAAGAAGRPLL